IVGSGTINPASAQSNQIPESYNIPGTWDLEADVVIIGSGPTGLVAANRASDAGASVIVVDANYDVGGHGLMNGGQIHLGGGTAMQKKYGIEDDPDTYFKDLIDWSVVETNGMPDYRYNDRGVQRAIADNAAATFDYLVDNGVEFVDMAPATAGGHAVGLSAPRGHYAIWTKGQSAESPRGGGGTAIYRALEVSARNKGIKFVLNYHMDVIYREHPNAGRVLGIKAHHSPRYLPGESTPMQSFHSKGNIDMGKPDITVKAKKSILIGTGGHTGNLNFRRIFDPRMTEEYQLAGGPFSDQDASGEIAAMQIGASLWGVANQVMERNGYFRKRPVIGCKHTYIEWTPDSILFPFVKATGLKVRSFRNVVLVNQMGKRFYSELGANWPYGTHHGDIDGY
ncbi:MAG: FAD-binding protein, partial [Gammaproteobacteria bacterium]|nr:FAD-binding protein [Gammaproteobacteria bacterium]